MRIARSALVALVVVVMTLLLVVPALAAPNLSDVPSNHEFYKAISDMADRGIVSGYTDGSFGPSDPVTRQQFAKMIVKTMDLAVTGSEVCPFGDVAIQTGTDPLYPSKYVAVCAAKGITTGKTATTFLPDAKITRQQVMTMIVRAADNLAPGVLLAAPDNVELEGLAQYADPVHRANVAKFQHNALDSRLAYPWDERVSWLAANASRGEVAQMLWNLIGERAYGSPWNNQVELIAPLDGAVFSNLPRTVTLSWRPVANAAAYRVIVNSENPDGTWWSLQEVVEGTSFTFEFVGAQRGTWDVRAIMPVGPESIYGYHTRAFEFTR